MHDYQLYKSGKTENEIFTHLNQGLVLHEKHFFKLS